MAPAAVFLHVVHVMSNNLGKEIWHTNIMALMIMAGVVLLTPINTMLGLFVIPWVGMDFNFLAYFLCYFMLMKL